ncbi:MAG: heparinase [Alphaproteobacteria bacterium]|nr:heparinase [Alphaproteobacteria bacterium]
MIGQARRLIETVRHLRPEQIYGRALHKFSRPSPDLRPAPPLRKILSDWAEPARKRQSLTGPNRFQFLNHAAGVPGAADWNSETQAKLWLYNLHYFDDLNAVNAHSRHAWHRMLVDRWIEENPPAGGNGWEPYPTSLRIVNWIKWALSGTGMTEDWHNSLAVQTRWLAKRLEHHLMGNHLFANAKALVFAGCYFSGDEADAWLETGLAILDAELSEQVLSDGGHFERSPMYHAIILEDVLDLINLAAAYPGTIATKTTDKLRGTVPGMLSWLDGMCHPDGRIAFFNDAAFAIAPARDTLRAYARRCDAEVPPPSTSRLLHLADSGYIRLEQDDCVALLDTAPVGPDYLPGHAHADTLSFEMSLFGHRLIVNGGTSVYGTGPERLRQRGTAAHSTVEIDGEASSEVWAGFRAARRAKPMDLRLADEDGVMTVACAHDGYHRLPGMPTHRRAWRLEKTRLNVRDHVEGPYGDALAHFPLAPHCLVQFAPGGKGHVGTIQIGEEHILSWRANAPASIAETTWHPEFGMAVPNSTLIFPVVDGELIFELNW